MTLKFLILVLICSLTNCAGPASPFGAINKISKPESETEFLKANTNTIKLNGEFQTEMPSLHFSNQPIPTEQLDANGNYILPEISLYPDRQVLHGVSDLTISIKNAGIIADTMLFRVFYDTVDVSDSIFSRSQISYSSDRRQMLVKLNKFKLSSLDLHVINIYFQANLEAPKIRFAYERPTCSWSEPNKIENTGPFKNNSEILDIIQTQSEISSINPSLIAGLVAQESGFNTGAVSWAKAIGLTQVATLAEQEVTAVYKDWPRHPSIPGTSVPFVKALILSGTINKSNEWRLNPDLSIKGGITYLEKIIRYWKIPENVEKFEFATAGKDREKLTTVLASYNSGPARVAYSMKINGKKWLESENLVEAKKYTNKVISYCYHFSRKKSAL